MKVYYSPVSPTSLSVILFCAEARIAFEPVVIDLMKGQQKTPDYLALNPWGLVPVLEDDGFVLTESSAILKYLADKAQSPAYPQDLRERARVNERMDWINTAVYRELGYHFVYPQILPHHVRTPDVAQESTLQWGREKAVRALSVLDRHGSGDHAYVCGDEITIADYFAAQVINVGSLIRVSYAPFPNVQRWLETMKALPSWKQVNEISDGVAASLASTQFVPLLG